MVKSIRLFLSFLLLSVSLLQFHKTDALILWKLSIVSTELGHWIALVTLALFIIGRPFARPFSKINLINSVFLFFATIFFLFPAMQMGMNKKSWSEALEKTFGSSPSSIKSPSFFELWVSESPPSPLIPETIIYKTFQGRSLVLDAYLPKNAKQVPWVLVIHGGGWTSGDRKQLAELNPILADHGIAAFSIDYRLAPQWHWPAPREDVMDAVTFIKKNAEKFRVDPSRWVILGRSAGGQIAESCAFQMNDPTLKGVISFYGPSDMEFAYKWGREDDILESRQVLRDFFGGRPDQFPDLYKDASSLNFVGKNSPPVLQFHGPLDPLVWVMHSRRLDEKLKSFGRATLLIEMPWATHAFDYTLRGPGGQTSTFAILYFLEREFNP